MVYIDSTGTIHESEPITYKTPFKVLWKIISFVIEFFLSMFGMESYWRQSSVNRYFMGSSAYSPGDDDNRRPPGGGGGGGGGGPFRSNGGLTRRIHTLPRSGGAAMPTCPGGACGRPG